MKAKVKLMNEKTLCVLPADSKPGYHVIRLPKTIALTFLLKSSVKNLFRSQVQMPPEIPDKKGTPSQRLIQNLFSALHSPKRQNATKLLD